MELTSKEEKDYQAAAGLFEAIISVATFKFTLEQWDEVEVDIRAAEDSESALIKQLDKLKEHDTVYKEDRKGEENELTIQYKPFSVSDELKDLEAEVEASMRAGYTLKNAGDVFKDTGLNCKLNGALGKEMKKDERRKKRETKKEEKRQKKLDREEEMIVKKYTKRIEMIMERYNKADKVQRKKDEKRRKQVEKHERKAQKNTVTSSILSFFRMFSCKKRQGKAVV